MGILKPEMFIKHLKREIPYRKYDSIESFDVGDVFREAGDPLQKT